MRKQISISEAHKKAAALARESGVTKYMRPDQIAWIEKAERGEFTCGDVFTIEIAEEGIIWAYINIMAQPFHRDEENKTPMEVICNFGMCSVSAPDDAIEASLISIKIASLAMRIEVELGKVDVIFSRE